MNILVTGAGSLIGHGILRSLREMRKAEFKIYTAKPILGLIFSVIIHLSIKKPDFHPAFYGLYGI